MNKESAEIIGAIEIYFKKIADEKPTPEEIEVHITRLLKEKALVNDNFEIQVIPIYNTYMLRTNNGYTCDLLGAMPSFCKVCGKILGKTPCTHEQ
jgi:hypothetical protein